MAIDIGSARKWISLEMVAEPARSARRPLPAPRGKLAPPRVGRGGKGELVN